MFIEPVSGENFFGRDEVIGTLRKRVTDLKGGYRQNIALAGPMLTGKSSILRHFLSTILEENVVPIYIDLDGAGFRVFAERFMATLLFGYLASEKIPTKNKLSDLVNLSNPFIPDTVKHVRKTRSLLQQKKKDMVYRNLLDLSSVFKKETGKNCLVVLDEFHNLSHYRLRTPFKIFGKHIMVQKDTMYIVSSSQKSLLKEILANKLSLLFGNFELVDVNGFDNRTAKSFIASITGANSIPEDITGYFLEISQGNPFYLRVLVETYDKVRGSCVSLGALENLLETLAELLYRSSGVLNQYFTNNINFFIERKSRRMFLPVLVSLARGNGTMEEMRGDMRTSDKQLRVKLKKLESMDLIYSNGSFFKITDKLFEYWLRNVYDLKVSSLVDDIDIKYLEFKERFALDFRGYSKFRLKDPVYSVENLFRSFSNQKIQVGLRCRKMPRFKKVTCRRLSENVSEIVGFQGSAKKWVCHVKVFDIAGEEDINRLKTFRSGSKSGKVSRRIFVPVKGMDQNALLLAKDENVWVWDVETLNQKLRLFGLYGLTV